MKTLLALVLLSFPAAAEATCPSALDAAAAEVQAGGGLNSATLRSVVESCGEPGPAALVSHLVARGACAEAAQLGRSLGDRLAVPEAVAAADSCLVTELEASLRDLDAVAADEAPPRAEPADDPNQGPRATASNNGVLGGFGRGDSAGFEGLGTRGSGAGGSGYAGAGEAARPRVQAKGKSSRNRYASTGAGRTVPSVVGERLAMAEPGGRVAWSKLSFGIWFDTDSAALRPEALGTVGALARHLDGLPEGTVLEIVGHTDSTGGWYYNVDLSERRAGSVQQALLIAGLPPGRLVTRGVGEGEPVANNYSAWGRSQNRRVEFRFYRPVAARAVTR